MVHCNKVTVTVTRYQDSNKVIALYSDSATLRGLCQVRPCLSEPLLVRMIKNISWQLLFRETNSFQASCQPKFGLHHLHNLHHLHVPLLRSHWCVRSTGVGRCKTRQDGIFIQIGAFLFRAIQRKTTNSVCQDCGDYHFENKSWKNLLWWSNTRSRLRSILIIKNHLGHSVNIECGDRDATCEFYSSLVSTENKEWEKPQRK